MVSPLNEVGIGITTRDRWADLAVTLDHLRSASLETVETIVIDDGSQVPLPENFRKRFPWVRFERSEKSLGYITQRNYLGRSLNAPFYLSLDDDSFPAAGSLVEAVTWLRNQPGVAVIGFKIIAASEGIPVDFSQLAPVATRDFTGCGFLLRRDLFLSIGGFEERLQTYCEEMEYSLRTFKMGYETYFFPGLIIRHMVSSQGRIAKHRDFMWLRNHVLTILLFYPFPHSLSWALWWTFIKGPHKSGQNLAARINLLSGAVNGWVLFLHSPRSRHRLSPEQLKLWRSKPFLASL